MYQFMLHTFRSLYVHTTFIKEDQTSNRKVRESEQKVTRQKLKLF